MTFSPYNDIMTPSYNLTRMDNMTWQTKDDTQGIDLYGDDILTGGENDETYIDPYYCGDNGGVPYVIFDDNDLDAIGEFFDPHNL